MKDLIFSYFVSHAATYMGVCIVSPYPNGNVLQRYKLEGTSSTSNIKSKRGHNQIPQWERKLSLSLIPSGHDFL